MLTLVVRYGAIQMTFIINVIIKREVLTLVVRYSAIHMTFIVNVIIFCFHAVKPATLTFWDCLTGNTGCFPHTKKMAAKESRHPVIKYNRWLNFSRRFFK